MFLALSRCFFLVPQLKLSLLWEQFLNLALLLALSESSKPDSQTPSSGSPRALLAHRLSNLSAVHQTYSAAYMYLHLDDPQLLRFESLKSTFLSLLCLSSHSHISSKSCSFYPLVTQYFFPFLPVLPSISCASQPASVLSVSSPVSLPCTVLPGF